MAKRAKSQEGHLWYPTLADVSGPSQGDFLGTGFVHSLPLGGVSEQDQWQDTEKSSTAGQTSCASILSVSWM